jgi:hypothetical protein
MSWGVHHHQQRIVQAQRVRHLPEVIEPEEGIELLREIHQGECGHHASSRALLAKAFRHGFYWPTAKQNAEQLVK